MTIRYYIHSKGGQTIGEALIDSSTTKNFMQLAYAKKLQLPLQEMPEPQMVFNIDGTPNKMGALKYYTDLNVQTGSNHTTFRFFLTGLGDRIILGYLWMSAMQPGIDWKRGWIDYQHLPIVLWVPGLKQQSFMPQNNPHDMQVADDSEFSRLPPSYRRQLEGGDRILIARIVVETKDDPTDKIPLPYRQFAKVFSEEASHEFPPLHIWDHVIELKPNAPVTLPGKIYPLSQAKLQELEKFVTEHLKRGTIQPSKSPYAASFFFIKKKNGKL